MFLTVVDLPVKKIKKLVDNSQVMTIVAFIHKTHTLLAIPHFS